MICHRFLIRIPSPALEHEMHWQLQDEFSPQGWNILLCFLKQSVVGYFCTGGFWSVAIQGALLNIAMTTTRRLPTQCAPTDHHSAWWANGSMCWYLHPCLIRPQSNPPTPPWFNHDTLLVRDFFWYILLAHRHPVERPIKKLLAGQSHAPCLSWILRQSCGKELGGVGNIWSGRTWIISFESLRLGFPFLCLREANKIFDKPWHGSSQLGPCTG